jgi:glycine/D-amino acid oxidase-like deaminating enzyme
MCRGWHPICTPMIFDIAAYEPLSGYADPTSTASSFMTRARHMGGRLLQDTTVTGIRMEAGRLTEVQTDGDSISTSVVVNAAGAWGGRIGAMVGIAAAYPGMAPSGYVFETSSRPCSVACCPD